MNTAQKRGTAQARNQPSSKGSDKEFFSSDRIHPIRITLTETASKALEPAEGAGRGIPGAQGGRPGGFPGAFPGEPGSFPGGRNGAGGGPGAPFDGQEGFPNNPGQFPGGQGRFPGGPGGFPGGPGGPPFGPGPGMGTMDFPVVEATLTMANRAMQVGLRYKGNSTFRMTAGTNKRPYKIDFNEFVDKQTLLGHTKLSANPNAADPSQVRETLAYEIFRAMKVPAPRTTFAEIERTVAGGAPQVLGLYTLVENVDDPLLDQWFGEHKGLLVKPEGAHGLRHLGDNWTAYARMYDPKGKVNAEQKRALIDFTRLVHADETDRFQREIDRHLDIDNFLRFLAVNVVVSNSDSFLAMGHNFYLYRSEKTGKFHFLPWDLNHAFGGFPGGGDPIRLALRKPHSGTSPLIERLLAMPTHQARYFDHCRSVRNLMANIRSRVQSLRAVVRPAVARESPAALAAFDRQFNDKLAAQPPRPNFPGDIPGRPDNRAPERTQGDNGFQQPGNGFRGRGPGFGPGRRPGGPGMSAPPLLAFIDARLASVDAQLAGKDPGVEPSDFGPGRPGGFPGGPGGFPGGPGGFPGRPL